ncbi:LacI family DNA-binding transcriptional regulator [Arcanobacterium hippocoleae]|uniref:DNA-binding LacI/PurR family transcriptional regulator n=1 Tax=Arcanobacterium hippocoleae TaxID=149017 RepID=A0ABU1T3X1_9ACTO|nr:LacI family DNA-binding transcriptional regulator [Arcanobacterium hippocoleae]MDR6939994.1 DNA-binding LacI/PurR family transcriptional regulator [Arcanobacterium hippocoleae]
MASKIRLEDIAKQAGVSTATVSRVLNDKSLVAPETRHAVIEALDLLGYERPEKLRRRSGGLIGMIVPELTNPIFPMFVQKLQTAMSLQGYTPLLATQLAGSTTEDAYVDTMLEYDVSGIVFLSGLHADLTANLDHYARITEKRIPYVTINGANPALQAPDFSCDDHFAAALAVRHLIHQGHTQIGLATGPTRFSVARAKSEAYLSTMRRLLPNVRPMQEHTLYTVEGGQLAAAALYERGCTAIIFASDVMALGAIRYFQNMGVDVPRNVSIIGFDDSRLVAFANPPLTTLHQPVKAMADAAVGTLIAMINGEKPAFESMKFPPELVVRASTGTLRKN